MGSGAFDLGQKILGEMSHKKKGMADIEKRERTEEEGGRDESSTLVGSSPADKKQDRSNFGGSILITHTHWDHIQGNSLLLRI
jgi:phosphoribosyl 1,2-cyclic phosphodiesterase